MTRARALGYVLAAALCIAAFHFLLRGMSGGL